MTQSTGNDPAFTTHTGMARRAVASPRLAGDSLQTALFLPYLGNPTIIGTKTYANGESVDRQPTAEPLDEHLNGCHLTVPLYCCAPGIYRTSPTLITVGYLVVSLMVKSKNGTPAPALPLCSTTPFVAASAVSVRDGTGIHWNLLEHLRRIENS
jgi:hypothetical protein